MCPLLFLFVVSTDYAFAKRFGGVLLRSTAKDEARREKSPHSGGDSSPEAGFGMTKTLIIIYSV